MNLESPNPVTDAESALRRIAELPAPQGLEDRIHRRIQATRTAAQMPRPGRVLPWPVSGGSGNAWLRSAAAAAIAFVVAGGGWGVYSRTQPGEPTRAIPAPQISAPQVSAPGSFGSAGAIRTPQTLHRPVLTHPAGVQDAPAAAAKKSASKKQAPKQAARQAARQAAAQASAPDSH